MKLKYKSLIFLILILFCVGSVCATDPHLINSSTDNNLTNFKNNNDYDILGNYIYSDFIKNATINYNYTDKNILFNNSNKTSNKTNMGICDINRSQYIDKNGFYRPPNYKMEYYKSKFYDLENNIIPNLKNIDDEIKTFLSNEIMKLNNIYNNLENPKKETNMTKLINSASKNVNKAHNIVTNNYINTLNYYIEQIEQYFYLKETFLNNNISVNSSLNIDIKDIDKIKKRINILHSIENKYNSLSNILNDLNKVMEENNYNI